MRDTPRLRMALYGFGALAVGAVRPAVTWHVVLYAVLSLTVVRMLPVAIAMIAWGAINSAIPVCWSTWLSKGVSDEPESGGGLMVGAIQLSIMAGGALGGVLLDHLSITATILGGCVLLVLAAVVVGNGRKLQPTSS